jgi:hypothetical protein
VQLDGDIYLSISLSMCAYGICIYVYASLAIQLQREEASKCEIYVSTYLCTYSPINLYLLYTPSSCSTNSPPSAARWQAILIMHVTLAGGRGGDRWVHVSCTPAYDTIQGSKDEMQCRLQCEETGEGEGWREETGRTQGKGHRVEDTGGRIQGGGKAMIEKRDERQR